MEINVIYFSRGKDLKKIAGKVAQICEVKEIDISSPHTLGQTDLLFIGIDERKEKTEKAVIDYLDNLPANSIKGAAIFSVSKDEKDYTELISAQLMHKGITVFPKNLVIKASGLFSSLSANDIEKVEKYTNLVLKSFVG
jgi:hypothetical protein